MENDVVQQSTDKPHSYQDRKAQRSEVDESFSESRLELTKMDQSVATESNRPMYPPPGLEDSESRDKHHRSPEHFKTTDSWTTTCTLRHPQQHSFFFAQGNENSQSSGEHIRNNSVLTTHCPQAGTQKALHAQREWTRQRHLRSASSTATPQKCGQQRNPKLNTISDALLVPPAVSATVAHCDFAFASKDRKVRVSLDHLPATSAHRTRLPAHPPPPGLCRRPTA